jgi:hypothetical protein
VSKQFISAGTGWAPDQGSTHDARNAFMHDRQQTATLTLCVQECSASTMQPLCQAMQSRNAVNFLQTTILLLQILSTVQQQ